MSVYVGVPMWPFRSMIMCHMFADTEIELDEMAAKLGLQTSWKQGEGYERIGKLVHYDIAKSKRAQAIKFGAIPCNDMQDELAMLSKVVRNAA